MSIFEEKMCAGKGARHTNIHTGEHYPQVSVMQAISAPPTHLPKEKGRWLIPSNYYAPDARNHITQKMFGRYTMLVCDIDKGNPSLSKILDAMQNIVGAETLFRLYSTRSATAENKKWRILIPLIEPVIFDEWELCQRVMSNALLTYEIETDTAMHRAAQLVFLPNCDKGGFFQSVLSGNDELSIENDTWASTLAMFHEEPICPPPIAKSNVISIHNHQSPIQVFNQHHNIENLFQRYYYQNRQGTHHWKSPYQTSGTFATRNYGDRWVSLSQSDADSGLGRLSPHGACCGDAFDLYTHFEHNNNPAKAIQTIKKLYGI